jgi:lipopolysaccharide/colanic/teichoic acid biosynthesis glycosyltransferase
MYPIVKRIIDFTAAFLVLLILLPFLLIIIIMLKLTGEGEVFYFQKRIGYLNRYFNIWKFATMLKNSPTIGTGVITVRNDPRVTFMGKFLRKSKLNELPQLINVLIGDMSLVGPRPLVQKTFDAYTEEVRNKVYLSKPGLTGIGSIIFRDEELLVSETSMDPQLFYNTVIAPYKGALELWYLKNKSIKVDFLIIFLTIWVIFNSKSDLPYKIFPDLPKRTF